VASSIEVFVRTILLILLAAFLSLTACAPPPRPPEPTDIVWPMPPEPPRIRYVQSIYAEDDIGRVYSFKEKLFGKDYVDTLERPYGVFVRNNKIFVTDIVMKNVLIFDLTTKRLSFAGGEGAIQMPSAAISDVAGNIYVADAGSSKIAVYDAQGVYKTAFPLQDSKPVALVINDALGRIYVIDRSMHRVIVLALDGRQLFEFGAKGDQNGLFNIPLSIALDRKGNVYVLDNGNFRVQIFDADGKFISKFGEVGDGPGFFANPKGIAVDSEGHIYITDAAFSNFQIFNQEGKLLMYVGSLGNARGQMHLPGGITVDENDRIYVSDQLNKRIEVFQYLKAQ